MLMLLFMALICRKGQRLIPNLRHSRLTIVVDTPSSSLASVMGRSKYVSSIFRVAIFENPVLPIADLGLILQYNAEKGTSVTLNSCKSWSYLTLENIALALQYKAVGREAVVFDIWDGRLW